LRETSARLPVYASRAVAALLDERWPVPRDRTGREQFDTRLLAESERTVLRTGAGGDLGLTCRAETLGHDAPHYARNAARPAGAFTIGVRIEDQFSGATFAYIPGAAAVDDKVRQLAYDAHLLLFDGTFWSDDELQPHGVRTMARTMGHVPLGGADGSLALLPRLGAKRTVLTHINNTNPILDAGSVERAQVTAAGIEVGADGMDFVL